MIMLILTKVVMGLFIGRNHFLVGSSVMLMLQALHLKGKLVMGALLGILMGLSWQLVVHLCLAALVLGRLKLWVFVRF